MGGGEGGVGGGVGGGVCREDSGHSTNSGVGFLANKFTPQDVVSYQ